MILVVGGDYQGLVYFQVKKLMAQAK